MLGVWRLQLLRVRTNHIRLSYANSHENLTEAVRRIRTVVEPLVFASAAAGAR